VTQTNKIIVQKSKFGGLGRVFTMDQETGERLEIKGVLEVQQTRSFNDLPHVTLTMSNTEVIEEEQP